MYKGGYQIIDLKDTAILTGGSAVTIPGIFEAVSNPYRKMTVVSRLKLDGSLKPDFPATFIPSGNDYIAYIDSVWTGGTSVVGHIMTVTDADAVTVAAHTILSAAE